MKTKYDLFFGGLLLILAGVIGMALQQGWISLISPQTWVLGFSALAAIFFVRYLLAGRHYWGWLFPTCISAALALIIWFVSNHYYHPWIVTPIFAALAIPFLVAFAVDVRNNWWALIPMAVFAFTGALVVFGEWLPSAFVGAGFVFAIGFCFLVVYLANRANRWALIPASALGVVGIMILLSLSAQSWMGALIPLLIASPFLYISIKLPQNWWAVIPAGILGSIGINVLLTNPALGKFAQSPFPGAILFAGWALTFGWLWRQRATYPTSWARIPALIAGIVALVLLVVGSLTGIGFVVVPIVAGLVLIYMGLRPKRENKEQVKEL